jgi:hypothetical protein
MNQVLTRGTNSRPDDVAGHTDKIVMMAAELVCCSSDAVRSLPW